MASPVSHNRQKLHRARRHRRQLPIDLVDVLALRFDGFSLDDYVGSGGSGDVSGGGTSDLTAAISHSNPQPNAVGTYTAEYRHPLNSADNTHDFSLAQGQVIGFSFTMADGDSSGSFGWPSPCPCSADILVAGASNPSSINRQQAQTIEIAKAIVSYGNKACKILNCGGYSGSVLSELITFIGNATTIVGLGSAAALAGVVAGDLDALTTAIHTYGRSSPEAKAAAHHLCIDNQALHAALLLAVPGLSLIFPVQACP